MPLREIRVGMKGFGKTVIQGTDIETFQVDILGILANNKINENVLISGKSILVKVRGEVIEKAGGIAAGMSGSPVYVNERLIGGLSSGWVMTDHTVGLVTPIEEMLEIWDYPLDGQSGQAEPTKPHLWATQDPILLAGRPIRHILEIGPSSDIPQNLPPEIAIFRQAAAPVILQGLSGRAANMLKRRFQSRKLDVSAQSVPTAPAAPSTTSNANPQGGQFANPPTNPAVGGVSPPLAKGKMPFCLVAPLVYNWPAAISMSPRWEP